MIIEAAPPLMYEPPPDDVFRLFQALVAREIGIHLGHEKKALLHARLSRRMRELRLTSFISYYRYVTKGPNGGAELQTLIDLITTNETSFFREPLHFKVLREKIIPNWKQRYHEGKREARVRAWSAGCSTGEEPYSLAMVLADELGKEQWKIDVLATDVSRRVLQTAQQATWPVERAAQIEPAYRTQFMLRGVGSRVGDMRAAPELRELVRFASFNLIEDKRLDEPPFDVIFCRNVLIYFAPETKRKVVRTLLSHLSHDGLLFLGHAETLADSAENVRCVGPNVYVRR